MTRPATAPSLRQVPHLVVVAGPSGSGKSTLVDALRTGRAPQVAAGLDLPDLASCVQFDLRHLAEADEAELEARPVVLSVSTSAFFHRHSADRLALLRHMMSEAPRVSVVTLRVSPWTVAARRLRRSIRSAVHDIGNGRMERARSELTNAVLNVARGTRSRSSYSSWLTLVETVGPHRHVVCRSNARWDLIDPDPRPA